jgi:hypothetical protein
MRALGIFQADARRTVLREKARVVIRTGTLPDRAPDRTWGGPGVGAPCSICDLPVEADQMEFEIQFAHDGGLDTYTFTSGASLPGNSSAFNDEGDSHSNAGDGTPHEGVRTADDVGTTHAHRRSESATAEP